MPEGSAPPPCRPPWWARGAHAQTLLGHWLPSPAPDLPWTLETLDLGDGDALRIRLVPGTGPRLVVLFHGLGGDAGRDYMRRAAAAFHARGYGVAAVNHRGAGEGRGLARRPYHSGATGDLAAVFRWLRARFPDRWLLAVGFSLSGNALLLHLGRDRPGAAGPDAALAVNPPADLDHCSRLLARGLNRLYDLRFVALLREDVRHRRALGLEAATVPPWATVRDFDEAFTAPVGGFRDRADYYARCGCGPHLAGIEAPTVILSAEDDPFAPASDLRRLPRSPKVRLHIETHGGHMGYVDAHHPGRRWLEPALVHYAGILERESGGRLD